MSLVLDHRHILVTATGLGNVPSDPAVIEDWLRRLVAAVGMNILIDPQAIHCPTPGNEGVTGIVCIETSHSSIHLWEGENAFLRMDLYSCAHFEAETVLSLIREFQPTGGSYMLIDRNDGHKVLGTGPVMAGSAKPRGFFSRLLSKLRAT